MTLIERDSTRPWPTCRRRRLPTCPTAGPPAPPQGRLVALDGEQEVAAPAVQIGRMLPLTVQCIGGDQDAPQLGRMFRAVVNAATWSPSTTLVWVSTSRCAWS